MNPILNSEDVSMCLKNLSERGRLSALSADDQEVRALVDVIEHAVVRRLAERAGKIPALPRAYSHIYPLGDDGTHDVCFTPSAQPGNGREHRPVFTAEQMQQHVEDYAASVVAKTMLESHRWTCCTDSLPENGANVAISVPYQFSDFPHARFIHRMSGRSFMANEAIHWTSLPPDDVQNEENED
jgi:hypothetical protein